jgi:hypothetical protein
MGVELFDGLSRRDVPAGAYSSDIHSVRVVELYDAAPVGAYVTIPTPAVVLRELSQILQKGCNPASENRASFLMGGLISIFSALFSAFCYL